MEYSCKCEGAARPSRRHLRLISTSVTCSIYTCDSCGSAWEWRSGEGWDLLLMPSATEGVTEYVAEASS